MLLRQTLLFLSRRKELEEFLKQNPSGQNIRSKFMAGNNRWEVLEKARSLCRQGFCVTLDYLGEDPIETQPVESVIDEYQLTMQEAAAGLDASIAVKPSLLGARRSRAAAEQQWLDLVRQATGGNGRLRVDMEESDLTETALDFARLAHREGCRAKVVIQSQMRRSSSDLECLNREKIPACLVKGAFLEPEDVCFQDREVVVLYFMRLVEAIMREGVEPVIATHDPKLVEFAIDMAFIFNREPEEFEFQMLYGINIPLQRKLLEDGYRVRINLPYGGNWYGYFMQRLAERPTRLWFLLRNRDL